MNILRRRELLAAGCLSVALAGAAHAGGFSRGSADTDIIFDDGNFNMRTGFTFVAPKREFSKGLPGSEGLVGTSYTEDYVIPSAAIKFNLTDNLRCAGTMVDNNGGSAEYAVPKPSGKLIEDFTTNEKAVTCGVKFQAGKGDFWLLGGGFAEDFDYHRENALGTLPGGTPIPNARLELEGQDFGYRIGAAYTIPEIAFRAQVMYRSGTNYGADGALTVPIAALKGAEAQQYKAAAEKAAAAGDLGAAKNYGDKAAEALAAAFDAASKGEETSAPSTGTGNLPQSVEFKLQSGIAPGWLAFGSVKWMDWSVQKELLVSNAIKSTADVYNWKDGWTVTGGVGHAFTDRISGLVALTWDSGVSTGYDLSTDTYTLAVGGSLKDSMGGELRGGIGYSYLTSAEVAKGDDTGLAVKAGHAIALNIGYNIKW